MTYQTSKYKFEFEGVDIPTMETMPLEDYDDYLRHRLLWVDHHNVLRGLMEHPVAVTKEQFRVLLEYLKDIEERVGA
jgi:hypothetical protein